MSDFEFENLDKNIENNIIKANNLAKDILIMCRNKLFVNFRFLGNALSKLKIETNYKKEELLKIYKETKNNKNLKIEMLTTCGEYIRYNFVSILENYKKDKNSITRNYMHVILHCIYRHLFVGKVINQTCWDLACDIAVENIINELNIKDFEIENQKFQEKIIKELKRDIKILSAEKIYRYYLDKNLTNEELESLRQSFFNDSHKGWYSIKEEKNKKTQQIKDNKQISQSNLKSSESQNHNYSNFGKFENNTSSDYENNEKELKSNNIFENQINEYDYYSKKTNETINDWKNIAEKLAIDMETFSKEYSKNSTSLIQYLKEINREKCDYSKFLKKFAVISEVMKVNDDEFDYIFYTYGLKIYDNLPLIEPLEYKDTKRIKEFVIAIDTSGSVQGELVQKFVEKTYNILKTTESFFSKINIHIIQCDNKIQEDKKITSQEEFDDYIKNMNLKGFSGTDFRPVFNHIENLIKQKELTNLKGLIYFTDGKGEYPQKRPSYETAFVFVDDGMSEEQKVPSWAIKVIMDKDEIKEL